MDMVNGDLEAAMDQSPVLDLDQVTTAAVVIDLTAIDEVVSISWPVLGLLAVYLTVQYAVEIVLVAGNVLLLNNLQTLSIVWKDDSRNGTVLGVLSLTYASSLLVFVWNQTDLGPVLARLCLVPGAAAPMSPATLVAAILFTDVMSRFVLESTDVLARTWSQSPSGRARFMAIAAGVSDLHRELVPVRVWLDVLGDGAGTGPGLGLVLRLAYLYAKSATVMGVVAALYRACKSLRSRSPIYGDYVTDGGAHLCPICREPARGPVRLP